MLPLPASTGVATGTWICAGACACAPGKDLNGAAGAGAAAGGMLIDGGAARDGGAIGPLDPGPGIRDEVIVSPPRNEVYTSKLPQQYRKITRVTSQVMSKQNTGEFALSGVVFVARACCP